MERLPTPDQADAVSSREELVAYVKRVHDALASGTDVENPTTDRFLDAARHEGRYRLAETAIRQALTNYQTQHGADHPDTLASRNNLAGVLGALGRQE
jgi:hypothetical protein